jgi:two-component sensor histidine kinase
MISYFARLSTGIKMLLILSAALLPLGLIALFASMESAQTNRLYHESEARMIASNGTRKLDTEIDAAAMRLRNLLARQPRSPQACRAAMLSLPAPQRYPIRLAIHAPDGERLCGDSRLSPWPAQPPRGRIGTEVMLLEPARVLRFVVGGPAGSFGVGEIPLPALASIAKPVGSAESYSLTLTQGTARLRLLAPRSASALDHLITATAPVAGGQAALEMVVRTAPITALEMLMVVLPLLMWAAAAVTGWLVVERLLLSPLGQMQRAISGYRAGDGPLILPRFATPAQEIRGLGESFRKVTNDLASHEAELEQGLARQTQLTREVHHRVKNNLQVVSSLINLHSRGVADQAVAAAYASIQRRVDALAIVHRNHYAELEENLGVSLRALIGELAANLRAMAPPEAARMAITLNMAPAFATQDVAVPVAFLITEIVELATICAPQSSVSIMLRQQPTPGRALLTIDAPGLDEHSCLAHPSMERFDRIILGLARQLRAPLHHEKGGGSYEIEINVVPDAGRQSDKPV